jgi:hypothetical protein
MTDGRPTLCVLVHRQDGTEIWVPKAEYDQNPESGSYAVNGRQQPPEAMPKFERATCRGC